MVRACLSKAKGVSSGLPSPGNSEIFVGDPPHNLPGSDADVKKYSSTIYVEAGDELVQGLIDIKFIVAYPHSHLHSLPFKNGNRMARQKGYSRVLDLPEVVSQHQECIFNNLNDLKLRFPDRFRRLLSE